MMKSLRDAPRIVEIFGARETRACEILARIFHHYSSPAVPFSAIPRKGWKHPSPLRPYHPFVALGSF